jgi:hypothetical protein
MTWCVFDAHGLVFPFGTGAAARISLPQIDNKSQKTVQEHSGLLSRICD